MSESDDEMMFSDEEEEEEKILDEAGSKETEELVTCLSHLIFGLKEAFKDGKLGVGDIKHFKKFAATFNSGIDGLDKIDEEVADLDGEERDRLSTIVSSVLSYGKEKAEDLVDDILEAGTSLARAAKIAGINMSQD